jgi:hypothetical protein
VIQGAEDEARRNGYSVILCNSNENAELEKHHLTSLYSRRVDGAILGSTLSYVGEHLSRERFPVVLVDRVIPGHTGGMVTTDSRRAAYEATGHLIGLGHNRSGLIAGSEKSWLERYGLSYAGISPFKPAYLVPQTGLSYYNRGYWIYRRAFQKVVTGLLPAPLIQSNAPLSTEITLTHQAAEPASERKERYLVHIVNFSPLRHTPSHPDFYEDPIALTEVTVRVNLPIHATTAQAVIAGATLPVRRTQAGGVEVTVPRVPIHEVVSLEVG